MSILFGLIAWLLHAALIALIAPWLVGYSRKLRARMQGRQGAPIMQSWRDLIRLWRKESLLADNASGVSEYAPLVIFGASAAAALLVPSFALGLASAPAADLLVIAGLFALARAATALAAMDAGTWFGGFGVSREALFAFFTEPALLLVFFALALMAGSTNLDHIADLLRTGALGLRVSLGLGLAAMIVVALTSLGRLPIGNPASHLELTMLHEATTLEFSGRALALIEAASWLRVITWLGLLIAIFAPFGIAPAASPLDWPLGLLAFVAKLLVLVAALAFFEAGLARMRIFRVPELLGIALMLALLAVLFLFVSQGVHMNPGHFGQLDYDMAHLLEGGVLLFSFVLLYQRRLSAIINTYTAQALTVAAACFWQSHVQHSGDLFATGVVTLLAKGIGFPWALHRIRRQTHAEGAVESSFGVYPSLALGLFLACLALLVVMRIPAGEALTRETLAMSLSVLLLGLAMMTTRSSALTQTVGFLSVENGLALAAIGVPGMPIVVELSVAFLVMIAFIVFGIFFFRIRAQFDSLELHHLDRITEAPE